METEHATAIPDHRGVKQGVATAARVPEGRTSDAGSGRGRQRGSADRGVRAGSRRRRVIIADDACGVADRLKDIIELCDGCEVVGIAQDGPGAIVLVETLRPDILVLDFTLPGASGLDVLRNLNAGGHTCMVIMCSNIAEPSIRRRCLAEGAIMFIDKASDIASLPEILEAICDVESDTDSNSDSNPETGY